MGRYTFNGHHCKQFMEQLTNENRCSWAKHQLEIVYHDTEWGIPVYDDQKLFEFLLLDSFQAGLSWLTILKKHEHFKIAFDNFDFYKIAHYKQDKIEALTQDAGIIRNQKKIVASVKNAQATIAIIEKHGSLARFLWSFVDNHPQVNQYKNWTDVPASTNTSDQMSKALKQAGFTFIGSTICYAFMQAAGMVNDHTIDCPRHRDVQKHYRGLDNFLNSNK